MHCEILILDEGKSLMAIPTKVPSRNLKSLGLTKNNQNIIKGTNGSQ
jgi:hypothetical protein